MVSTLALKKTCNKSHSHFLWRFPIFPVEFTHYQVQTKTIYVLDVCMLANLCKCLCYSVPCMPAAFSLVPAMIYRSNSFDHKWVCFLTSLIKLTRSQTKKDKHTAIIANAWSDKQSTNRCHDKNHYTNENILNRSNL